MKLSQYPIHNRKLPTPTGSWIHQRHIAHRDQRRVAHHDQRRVDVGAIETHTDTANARWQAAGAVCRPRVHRRPLATERARTRGASHASQVALSQRDDMTLRTSSGSSATTCGALHWRQTKSLVSNTA